MLKEIKVNFKNILSEMRLKEVELCFLKNRGLFIEDSQENLYQMDIYNHGTYLDNLIKKGITLTFYKVESDKNNNMNDWEKEVWSIQEVTDFMKRQNLQ